MRPERLPDMSLGELLALLSEDRALLEMLLDEGLLPAPLERSYSAEEAEQVRVARVLVRELEVNLAGVEVILHMRQQILSMRGQIAEVLQMLQEARRER